MVVYNRLPFHKEMHFNFFKNIYKFYLVGGDGALSKNRTCDSSLPRTCFTTRLLGRQNFFNYTKPQEKIKDKK